MKLLTIFNALITIVLVSCINQSATTDLHPLIQHQGIEASITTHPSSEHKGVSVITIHINDENGPLDLHANTETRVMQISCISDNLRDYFHEFEHFEEIKPGTYRIQHTFTENGNYTFWLDVLNTRSRDHHGDLAMYRGIGTMQIAGTHDREISNPSLEATFGEYTAKLSLRSPTTTGGAPYSPSITLYDSNNKIVELADQHDPFYFLVEPAYRYYRLEHFLDEFSNSTQIKMQPIVFSDPGTYALWTEIYIKKENSMEIVHPYFIFSIDPSKTYLHSNGILSLKTGK